MKIALILAKGIAPLDSIASVLEALSARGDDVSIFLLTPSKRQLLRGGEFYEERLRSAGVRFLDLIDCADLSPLERWIARRAYLNSSRDSAPVTRLERWAKNFIRRRGLAPRVDMEVAFPAGLKSLDPDLILLDHSSSLPARQAKEVLKKSIAGNNNLKVVLLPHAPHHVQSNCFAPYLQEDRFPEFCDFWMTLENERSWEALPDQRERFFYSGYPGMDRKWLDSLRASRRSGEPVRIVYLIRRFLNQGQQRGAGDNEFVMDFEEFEVTTRAVLEAVAKLEEDVKLVIKPHPSNDFAVVDRLVSGWSSMEVETSGEPIYHWISRSDCMISLYSTAYFPAIAAGIPCIVLPTEAQEFVESQNETMSKMYLGLRGRVRSLEQLDDTLQQALNDSSFGEQDCDHLRNFYPDGSVDRSVARIDYLVSGGAEPNSMS